MKIKRNNLLAIFSVLVVAVVILGTCQETIPDARAAPFLGAPTNPGITNLAACWDFEEHSGTRYDWTDNNNDLSDNNTVTYGTGISGNAADFEMDNNEYFSITDNTYVSMGDVDMTITGWLYMESKSQNQYLVMKWNSAQDKREYFLYYTTSTDRFSFSVSSLGTSASVHTIAASTFGSPNLETWYFFELQYDSVNDLAKIAFSDGTFDTVGHSGGIFDSDFGLTLSNSSATNDVDGKLDSTMIYKRLLTADELTWLYNSGAGRACGDLNPPTPTNTFTITNTPTDTFTPTNTFTITNTPTETFTLTNTWTPSPTFTFTRTPTLTFTVTDTLTPTETATSTFTRTFTVTRTPTRTLNPTEISATEAWEATYTAAIPGYVTSAEDNAPLVAVVASLCGILVLAGLVVLALYVTNKKRRT